MNGEITFVGELSIGALCPLIVGATGTVLAQLQAKLQGCIALAAKVGVTPPAINASLQIAIQMVATLTAAVALSPPAINFAATAIASLIAQIEANLQLLLQLQALLGAEAFVYTYAGDGASFGPTLATQLAAGWPDGTSPLAPVNALLLATTSPAAWAALTAFFGGAA